jgi:aspartyl-tRNA(Asn)/glutamyl-tRNA(Gln) amidotransferase subunit C
MKQDAKSSLDKTRAQLTRDEIEGIARLAGLAIDKADVEFYAHDLSRILDLVEQINAIDTSGVVPMAHPLDMTQRLRPDLVTQTNQRELFQSIAPLVRDGLYLVPRVIE